MSILQNFKLVTQILCFILFIMLLCLGLQLGIIYVNYFLFGRIVLDSSLQILNKQIMKEIKTYTHFSEHLIERYQVREIKRLESVNKIYQFTWDKQLNLINIEQCLNKEYSKYSGQYSLCYGIMNPKANLNETFFEKYIKIANIYSVCFLMADNKFDLVFAGVTKEKFLAVWPQQGIIDFDPQTRPWFILEQKQGNNSDRLYQTQFTKPFIHTIYKSVTISHTQSLYDKDFSRIGVVTIQLNFSSTFPQFLQNNQRIKGYILDQNYNILQGNIQYSTINTFFDQNITGFNQSNLNILQTYLNQGQILQKCQKLNDKLLCLQDINQQEFIIEAYKLRENNQFFILVLDPTKDLQILEQREQSLDQQVNRKIYNMLFQTVFPYFCLLIFSLTIILKIVGKISRIILEAKNFILKDTSNVFKILQFNIFNIEYKNQINALDKLEIAFANLNEKIANNKNINPLCKQMVQQCGYPNKAIKRKNQFYKSIKYLGNKNFTISKKILTQIIQDANQMFNKSF